MENETLKRDIEHNAISNTLTYLANIDRLIFFYLNDDGERIYFKADGPFSIAGKEILGSILNNKLGLPKFEPMPAYYTKGKKTYFGIISKDYVKNRENTEVISLKALCQLYKIDEHFSVEEILNILNLHVKKSKEDFAKNLVIDPNLENNLKKLALFFYISGQQDSNKKNIEFVVEKKDNNYHLSLAPFIDNSISFFRLIKYDIPYNQVLNYAKSTIEQMKFFFSIKNIKDNSNYLFYNHLTELANEIVANDELKEMFKKIYNLNFKEEVFAYLRENNITLRESHVVSAVNYFVAAKSLLAERVMQLSPNFFYKNFNKNKQSKKQKAKKQNEADYQL